MLHLRRPSLRLLAASIVAAVVVILARSQPVAVGGEEDSAVSFVFDRFEKARSLVLR